MPRVIGWDLTEIRFIIVWFSLDCRGNTFLYTDLIAQIFHPLAFSEALWGLILYEKIKIWQTNIWKDWMWFISRLVEGSKAVHHSWQFHHIIRHRHNKSLVQQFSRPFSNASGEKTNFWEYFSFFWIKKLLRLGSFLTW